MDTDTDAGRISHWWRTSLIDMAPGRIVLRGHPVQELIGTAGLAQVIWLLLRGTMPGEAEARLLEAALVAGVDHGPQAPSIAIARMAATCGVGLNNAMASAVNTLGDVHGGAGEQCAGLCLDIARRLDAGAPADKAVRQGLDAWCETHGRIIPGFGHRFHRPADPRTPRLMALLHEAAAAGTVSGRFATIGEAIQAELERRRGGRPIAMNVDGATAVVFCELGFPAPLSRGLFCLSRSIGILAHAWEQMQQGGRNKGPVPPQYLPLYEPAGDDPRAPGDVSPSGAGHGSRPPGEASGDFGTV